MRYSFSEKIWIGVLFAVLIILSAVLYADINRRITVEGENVIGSITYKQRTVQRKYAKHVVWEDLEQNYPLHNKDSIRTTAEADAEITLNDGTKINLSENSMILLNLDENKTNIDFAYGAVSAKSEGGNAGKSLSITSGENSVSIGNGDVKLSKGENKDLNVTVEKGIAEIFSSGKEGQKIGVDQKASLGENSDKIEIKKIDLKPLSPPDNARFFSKESKIPILFEYSKDNANSKVSFELANSSDFKKVILSKNTSDKSLSLPLKEGVYYWRIKSGKDVSPSHKLTVLQNRPVEQVSPSNGYKLTAPNSTVYVSFSWTKSDLASNYKLEISPNADFSSNVQSSVQSANYISFQLARGKYFWRVGANLPSGDGQNAFLFSNIRSFEIIEPERAKPPTLFNPANKSSTYSVLVEKKGILFNWAKDSNLESYEFQLSTSPKFDSMVTKKNTPSNSVEIKEKLQSGFYYWRVNGKSKDGTETNFSSPSIFEIKDIKSLKTFAPVNNENISIPDLNSKGLLFAWEKLPIVGTYSIQFSNDSSFQKIIQSISVSGNKYLLKELPIGSYFWRVSLISETGDSYLISSPLSLVVSYMPDAPKLLLPKPNASIGQSVASINFRWSKGNTTQYYFKITQKTSDGIKEIFSKSVSTNEIKLEGNEFPLPGLYDWSVIGVGEDGTKSSESISKFQVIQELVETKDPNLGTDLLSGVVLIAPLNGQAINISKANEIIFKWTPIAGVKQYKFKINDGKKDIYTITTDKTDLKFSKLELLDRKQFSWSVSPVSGKAPNETSGTFKVELDEIKDEIQIISPDIQYAE
jgi:hypothetical protein